MKDQQFQFTDTHFHFIGSQHTWVPETARVLQAGCDISQLRGLLAAAPAVSKVIAVQALDSLEETRTLCDCANNNFDVVAGFVGWVPLKSQDIRACLRATMDRCQYLVGVRHIGNEDGALFTEEPFVRGVNIALAEYGLAFDVLLTAENAERAGVLLQGLSNTGTLVYDHMLKVPISEDGPTDSWRRLMEQLSTRDSAYMKLSGMFREADKGYTQEWFFPYFNFLLEVFGEDRLLVGSDYPVCAEPTLSRNVGAVSYAETFKLVLSWFNAAGLSVEARLKIASENATRAYKLK